MTRLNFFLQLTAIVCATLLVHSSASLCQADETDESRWEYSYATSYLVDPIAIRFEDGSDRLVHRCELTMDVNAGGGSGKLILDGNTCELNEFGDPTSCTEAAYPPLKVKFHRVKLADPGGRKLYTIEADSVSNYGMRVVVPRLPIGRAAARLLLMSKDEKAILQIITLENTKFRAESEEETAEEDREDRAEASTEDYAGRRRVVSIDLKKPRVPRVRPGEFIQLYWDFMVVPGSIVEDLETEFDENCESVSPIGVGGTGKGLAGADQISSVLYAIKKGKCKVTVTPIIGGKPQTPISLNFNVR